MARSCPRFLLPAMTSNTGVTPTERGRPCTCRSHHRQRGCGSGDDLNLRAILHRAGFAPSGRFGVPASSFGEWLVYRRADPSGAVQRLRVLLDRLVLTSRPRRVIRRQNRRIAAALRSKIG
jgi:hypothetical protein